MNVSNTQPLKPSSRRSHNQPNSSGQSALKSFWKVLQQIAKKIGGFLTQIGRSLRELWHNFLRSFARWADPRLEPYRDKPRTNLEPTSRLSKDTLPIVEETIYTPAGPETREDLFALLREAPMSVLTGRERKAMAAILNLPDVQVSEIMTPKAKMVFVDKYETLGPLVLDRLYKTGFTYFPVVDGNQHVVGTLQTAMLNSLDVKETKQAFNIMDACVFYIRADYSLETALKAFVRTGSQLMLVVDHSEKLVGMLCFAQILDYLFAEKYQDGFDRDDNRAAVAKRRESNLDLN